MWALKFASRVRYIFTTLRSPSSCTFNCRMCSACAVMTPRCRAISASLESVALGCGVSAVAPSLHKERFLRGNDTGDPFRDAAPSRCKMCHSGCDRWDVGLTWSQVPEGMRGQVSPGYRVFPLVVGRWERSENRLVLIIARKVQFATTFAVDAPLYTPWYTVQCTDV
jgi:hypothetical protein